MDLSTRACLPLLDIKRDGRRGGRGAAERREALGDRSSARELVGVDGRWDGSAVCHRGVRRGRQVWEQPKPAELEAAMLSDWPCTVPVGRVFSVR